MRAVNIWQVFFIWGILAHDCSLKLLLRANEKMSTIGPGFLNREHYRCEAFLVWMIAKDIVICARFDFFLFGFWKTGDVIKISSTSVQVKGVVEKDNVDVVIVEAGNDVEHRVAGSLAMFARRSCVALATTWTNLPR